VTGIRSLHVIGSKTLGGAERWCQRFTAALSAAGHPADVAVRAGYDLDAAIWGGGNCHPLPMRTVWDPLSRREVGDLVRRLAPDIVQTYMGRATRLTHLPAGRRPVHVARLGGYYKLRGFRHAHAWVCNTRGLCDYLVSGGMDAARVFHIGNFLDLPAAGPPADRAAWSIPADAWVVLAPGRFVEVKGARYLLEALSRLPAAIGGRPLFLVMMGEGVLEADLRRRADALGIEARVRWVGWQADTAPYYRMADLVAFPSLEAETFGNVVLEAWAFRRPLVTTAFRGALEYVRDGEDAVRVPCRDPRALAEGLRWLLENREEGEALAEAGYERVAGEFSRERVLGAYVELYRDLLSA
jgi:glycosyltransferase involved in cell wall biosynthesis